MPIAKKSDAVGVKSNSKIGESIVEKCDSILKKIDYIEQKLKKRYDRVD